MQLNAVWKSRPNYTNYNQLHSIWQRICKLQVVNDKMNSFAPQFQPFYRYDYVILADILSSWYDMKCTNWAPT